MSSPLEVDLFRIGPVTEASVALGDLTVVIGPNNAGKSFIAKVIKAVGQTIRRFSPDQMMEIRGSTIILRRDFLEEQAPSEVSRIFSELVGNRRKDSKTLRLPPEAQKELYKWFWTRFAETFSDQLRRNFGSDLGLLKATPRSRAKICLRKANLFDVEFSVHKKELVANVVQSPPISFCPGRSTDDDHPKHESIDSPTTVVLHAPDEEKGDRGGWAAIHQIDMAIVGALFDSRNANVYYFPAGRTGIMQGQYEIMSSLIELTRQAGLSQLSVPELSGSLLDFLQYVVDPRKEEGPLAEHLKPFEHDLYAGEISYDFKGKDKRALVLRTETQEIPLNLMSSSVTEIAPLVAFLKHHDGRGGTIIIEEPEAHLHPKNQVIMARLIAKIAAGGHRIFITTHSDILLEELSNIAVEGGVARASPGKKSKQQTPEVRAYQLARSKVGYKSERLNFGPEGIETTAFDSVREEMYDRFVSLRSGA